MRAEILRRLEALERVHVDPLTVWIPEPEGGLHGWEIMPGNGETVTVRRREGETEDELKARAQTEIRALNHAGMIVCFAVDAKGGTR